MRELLGEKSRSNLSGLRNDRSELALLRPILIERVLGRTEQNDPPYLKLSQAT